MPQARTDKSLLNEIIHLPEILNVMNNLPHPLKCSKCGYIAKTVQDSKQHWLDHD